MKIPYGGLIFNQSIHYIDHLAPFCALQNWPLIVCENSIANLCRQYYPGLKVIETSYFEIPFPSTLVCCEPGRLISSAFPNTEISCILWLPHGNSDKGWKKPFFQALENETGLIYGDKMADFLRDQRVSIPTIRIGNFRLHYWHQNKAFYDSLMKQILPPRENRRTYLYAPTWNDTENNSSFWEFSSALFQSVPKNCHLLVKIHPNMEHQDLARIEKIRGIYENSENILFLDNFPPIYPLLNLCDAYIGDMSSIGYDFLYWNRPMYFFNVHHLLPATDPSLFLHRCGKEINLRSIQSIFDPNAELPEILNRRKQVYEYTFDRSAQYRLRLPSA